MSNNEFTFNISLSVLDHLGRNLYRSFATVLGEAISNSWDADAESVWVYIDREEGNFLIKDDGVGMTAGDFQNKFLKIGYSKRKAGRTVSPKNRPYIGRKGIGKLALLSCAQRIHVISKTSDSDYVGGIIDNSGLDEAITEDLTPQEYPLREYDLATFGSYTEDHEKGTIIYFENIKEGIRNRLDYLKKIMALYFRFSLLDDSFNIFLDEEKITLDHLKDLAEKTEFLWRINSLKDPYIDEKLTKLKEPIKDIEIDLNANGFIASVTKPRYLKAIGTDQKLSVDLFVNGRIRETDILKHIPTARIAENYFYGQIHFNELDDIEKDRFTTSREAIIDNDPKYRELLGSLRKRISRILEDWDVWRLKHKEEGDHESKRISRKKRASLGLYDAVSKQYEVPEDSENRTKVEGWSKDLRQDAAFNFGSYAECFVSENIIRKYVKDKGVPLPEAEKNTIQDLRNREERNKTTGNVSIELRQEDDDLSYLDMDPLTKLVDPQRGPAHGLTSDAKQYKPIRNALMHTALLTDMAKTKLSTIYENIRARIKALLSS